MRFDRYAKEYRRKGLGRSPIRRAERAANRRWRGYTLALLGLALLIGAAVYYAGRRKPVAVLPPAAAVAQSPASAAAPERTAALPPLSLPADDAAHGSGMEWWYYSGILDGKDGGRYAFHMAVFVANGLVKQTVVHAALADLQSGRRYQGQSRTGGLPAGEGGPGFDFRQDGWRVSAAGPTHALRADFEGAGLALDMQDAHPPVAHRAAGSATPGLIDFGPSGISYYYSRPRLAAQGFIQINGHPVEVSGPVWFDHQWGDFDVLQLGWNWFALHLADGSDLMLYQLFDADGSRRLSAGTLAGPSGTQALAPGEVQLTPGRHWVSPRTQIDYVVEWTLQLPSGRYEIRPLAEDSEFDASDTSANVYWEGPVRVSGSGAGEGFLELSGYDRLHSTAQAAQAATGASAGPAAAAAPVEPATSGVSAR